MLLCLWVRPSVSPQGTRIPQGGFFVKLYIENQNSILEEIKSRLK